MKKVFGLLVSACLLASATACSGGSQSTSGGESKEISMWAYEPESKQNRAKLEDLTEKFEQENDVDVKITFIPKDNFNTKLNSSIAAGKNPDVAYLDQPLLAQFAKDGVLLNIDKYANGENGINKDEFFQGAFETAQYDGKLYGLPMNQTTVALFYNKDLMPEPPKTWDEWVEKSKAIYKKNEIAAFEGLGTGGWAAWLFPALVHGAGGTMVNEDATAAAFGEKAGVESLELMNELKNYSDKSVVESQNAFGNGLVATKISGAWEIGGFETNFPNLNFGVALIPSKDGKSYSNIGGENLVVFKNSENGEDSYELIRYLTNEENALTISDITGNFPVRKSAADNPKFSENEHLSVFLKQLETSVARPAITNWLKINDEVIGKAIDEVLVSGKSAEDTLKTAQGKANNLIKSGK
ncbi:ABC transporter substrate-binding protein [Neobacillus niacini]|uniref:ABC transporter substrate-binding protein n=1 Tax=Neobacillus niacini TaxID=86668 RepID=UPI0039833820